jgi:methanogenic corrinoid protein MtbC1
MMNEEIEELEEALLALDRVKVKHLLTHNSRYITLFETVEKSIVPTMERIGAKWESGEVALSQVYMSGKICEEVVDEILPHDDARRISRPKIAILVYRDFHMLGKRIVLAFLRASGYQVIDYGSQNNNENIINYLKEDQIDILLVSVLMLNSALHLQTLIKAIKQANLKTKVVVGGAPFRFDKGLYQEIGADASGGNASDVLKIINELKVNL